MNTAPWISLFILLFGWAQPQALAKKTIIKSVTAQEIQFLKKVESKYQSRQGLHMTLKRKVRLAALGTEKHSSGEAWIHKGKLNLDIQSPIPEKVVLDGKYIWMVSPAPKEFKGARTQVIQAAMSSKRARSQGLLQILTRGGFLKYFKIVGVEKEGPMLAYWLQPGRDAKEFKRAQVLIHSKDEVIRELRFWDRMGNLTNYSFTKTDFDQPYVAKKFRYTPPKDADITTL